VTPSFASAVHVTHQNHPGPGCANAKHPYDSTSSPAAGVRPEAIAGHRRGGHRHQHPSQQDARQRRQRWVAQGRRSARLLGVDRDIAKVEFRRVEYDVEKAAQAVLASDLPDEFAGQLREARGSCLFSPEQMEEAGDVTGLLSGLLGAAAAAVLLAAAVITAQGHVLPPSVG